MVVLEILQRNLTVLVRHPLATLLTLVLGAAAGFAYSYLPLHSSKLWQIEHLENRVQVQRAHIQELEAEVSRSNSEREELPEPGELEALESRLAEAEKRADELERERKSFQSKIGELTRSRDAWRKKHGAAESRVAELEREAAALAAEPPPEKARSALPAAPAASPWPSEVRPGTPPGLSPPPQSGAGTRPDLQ